MIVAPLWRCWPRSLLRLSFTKPSSSDFSLRLTRTFSYSSRSLKDLTKPLHILFCGSDELSVSCLDALHKESCQELSDIKSIDVVCRPAKRSGRGLKSLAQRPLADTARRLGLRLHELDTFTGWELPNGINLILVVSFGLFVPRRILDKAKWGGLNVHPSMLPDLRGAAPLHWTLLYKDDLTGVTLQTLHPSKIDHGMILKQTPYPGFEVPGPPADANSQEIARPDPQYQALFQKVQQESSRMLVEGIRDRIFVPPLVDVRRSQWTSEETQIRPAPKIKDEHNHIDWSTWTADDIGLRHRVIGNVWSYATATSEGKHATMRLKFTQAMTVADETWVKPCPEIPPGCPYVAAHKSIDRMLAYKRAVLVNTCDGKVLHVNEIRPESGKSQDPLGPSMRLGLMEKTDITGQKGDVSWTIWKYTNPLE